MSDLTEFLNARLDEDEARAKGWAQPGGSHWPWVETRILREVAAMRVILAEHAAIESDYGMVCRACVEWQDDEGTTEFGIALPQSWTCATVRSLAAMWDYRQETMVASPGGDGNGPAPVIAYVTSDGTTWHPEDVTIVRRR